MSQASKITLAATALGTMGIVYFVHWSQEQEKQVSLCTLPFATTGIPGAVKLIDSH